MHDNWPIGTVDYLHRQDMPPVPLQGQGAARMTSYEGSWQHD
jgi:hypothetical protein